jgi:DNA recombination protein RmuC
VKTFGSHMERVGRSLRQTVEHFNRSVGSLEGRVLPSARRLETLGAAPDGAELETMEPVEAEPRILQAPELTGPAVDTDAEKNPV